MIGFGTYDSEGIKLGISVNYSATLGLKTGCHGYFMLLDISHWVGTSDGRYIDNVIDTRDILHCRYNIESRNEKRGFRYDNHAYLLQLIN